MVLNFGSGAWVKVASPGRINLIGEHTDYNMGYVMPAAIDKKIYFKLRTNGEANTCTIYSETLDAGFQFELDNIVKSKTTWKNYILGVVKEIQGRGKTLQGFECTMMSELPIGAGISSSAALECGLATGLNTLFGLGFSKTEIVHLSQAAENNFVGSQCGIMDQYASVMSKNGHVILLDCLDLKARFIPADFKTCKILLVNTKVSHSLAEGEYNTRRAECELALEILKEHSPEVATLRDVNFAILNAARPRLTKIQYSRVLYVLEENQRVIDAAENLRLGDLNKFGTLMYQSHYGLRDLYDVSCKELDFLVEFTEDKPFIYGSRMMGGGFGGCTINLIEKEKITEFEKEVSAVYYKEFGIYPEFISVYPGEGVSMES